MTKYIENRHKLLVLGLLVGLAILAIASLFIGPSGFFLFATDKTGDVILQYRGARIVLAIIAGSSLAASGASLQAIFRNSLADPHIFGISGGAALGASIVIAFLSEQAILPSAGAIVGGLLAFFLLFFYVNNSPSGSLGQCLLVGVLINSVAAALITMLKASLPVSKTQSLLFWLIGHITVVDPYSFFLIVPLWLLGIFGLFAIRSELELLSFGVDESRLLGVNTDRIIKIAVVANCILIGNVVAFAGMIGFLGLVVPHLVRLLVSANQFVVLPISTIVGAILLVFFDTVSRMSFVVLDSEIPTGALCALILAPAFFLLLLREHRDG